VKRGEEGLQRALVAFLRASLPRPWIVFHCPNGGGRSRAEGGILKAMGTLPGVPDLLIFGPGRPENVGYSKSELVPTAVIAIELKSPEKKPRLSNAQQDVINTLALCGIPTIVTNDFDEAVAALKKLGVPMKGRAL